MLDISGIAKNPNSKQNFTDCLLWIVMFEVIKRGNMRNFKFSLYSLTDKNESRFIVNLGI